MGTYQVGKRPGAPSSPRPVKAERAEPDTGMAAGPVLSAAAERGRGTAGEGYRTAIEGRFRLGGEGGVQPAELHLRVRGGSASPAERVGFGLRSSAAALGR